MIIIKITKIGKVDNPYNVNSTFGESKEYHLGVWIDKPQIGQPFKLYPTLIDNCISEGISTSAVTKIIDDNIFETLNSVYKIELYGND